MTPETHSSRLAHPSQVTDGLSHLAAQEVLFAQKPSRLALTGLHISVSNLRIAKINVWRNHGFEPLLPLIQPYAAYGGWHASFRIGAYDDAMMFADRQDAEAELLWLDSERFLNRISNREWLDWLRSRVQALRVTTKAPIIVAAWVETDQETEALRDMIDNIPGTYFADMKAVCASAGVALLDQRSAALAGTPVGNAAQLVLARELGCHWLPAVLFPPIKAVAVDLDNTLHLGVLGEDGIDGVQLPPDHIDFQRFLKSLQKRGIFIALVSRNERGDVEALFNKRDDYPLRWDDFSAIEVSWGDKASALKRVAAALRIAPEAILFVDDNAGELANVAVQLPQIHTAFAHIDADLTRRVVSFYPSLWRWKLGSDDTKRVRDLKTSAERNALAETLSDPAEYFRSLNVSLAYRNNPHEQLNRLADLCLKTNQFNLTMQRSNHVDLARYMEQDNACVSSVHLTDRLSDSGVIAVIVAERQGDQLTVVELCISCRAMGRQLEDAMILLALRGMPNFPGCSKVAFKVQHGPRNQPALNWMAKQLGLRQAPSSGIHTLPAQRLLDYVAATSIKIFQE